MRTVAEDEVVQHVRVEAGEGPADSTAPVVTDQGELGDVQTLHQTLDVVRQFLQFRAEISIPTLGAKQDKLKLSKIPPTRVTLSLSLYLYGISRSTPYQTLTEAPVYVVL